MNFIKRRLKKKLKRNILINCRTHENNDDGIKFKCDFLKTKFFLRSRFKGSVAKATYNIVIDTVF